jgi:hypothetical protein
MIRKIALAVAVLAVGFVVAAPAQAGGSGSGAKKTATLRARNIADAAVYAFALPNGTAAPTTASGAQALGAKQIPVAGVGNFPVAPGVGIFQAGWASYATAAAPALPPRNGTAYSAVAGKTGYVTISGNIDLIDPFSAPNVAPGGGPF